jgi:hypothetical protein
MFERAGHWVADNWEYIAAGALIVAGAAIMLTGVGGPIGAAMIGGALLSGGLSAGTQKLTTGEVDWGHVAVDGAIGGLAGGAGAWAGGARALTSVNPILRGGMVGAGENVLAGGASRAAYGQNPFDPRGIAEDVLVGGATGAGGARLAVRGGGGAPELPGTTTTPTDLHAFGNRTMPRPPRPGTDLHVSPEGTVGLTDPPTGASTFGDPAQAPLTGHYHQIPGGTEMPEGLRVLADGSDVGGPHPPTHHTIVPSRDMPMEEFTDKFNNLPWEYAGKK